MVRESTPKVLISATSTRLDINDLKSLKVFSMTTTLAEAFSNNS